MHKTSILYDLWFVFNINIADTYSTSIEHVLATVHIKHNTNAIPWMHTYIEINLSSASYSNQLRKLIMDYSIVN